MSSQPFKNTDVDILLSVFNGELYLKEQIESILSQTYKGWRLLIRDDLSTDSSLDIIEYYANKYNNQIILCKDDLGRLGAMGSFDKLVNESSASYVMFCDQDDIWLENKIQLTIYKIHELENIYGSKIPLLVHTDLRVVDEKKNVISDSFWQYQNISPNRANPNQLLVQNIVTGCTLMCNSMLLKVTHHIPREAIMHDWWLALVASVFGKIGYISSPTVLYRQHRNNEIGAKNWNLIYIYIRIKQYIFTNDIKRSLINTSNQAEKFYELYSKIMPMKLARVFYEYANFYKKNFMVRKWLVIKYSFWKKGFIRNIALMLVL